MILQIIHQPAPRLPGVAADCNPIFGGDGDLHAHYVHLNQNSVNTASCGLVSQDVAVGGANLEVESQIGIPSSFDLVINVERSNHHCHVVWRKARRIGVAFD
ncbi:MAG TPA: hypothetical protein VF396_14265, partial [Bradyrhizobium sp.]